MTITLTYSWSCCECLDHGTGPKSDLEARRHEKATGHSTKVVGRPE